MFSFARSAVLSKFVLLSLVLSLVSPTTLFAFSEGLMVVAGPDQTISLGESLVLDGEAYASNLDTIATGLTEATIDWGDGTIDSAVVSLSIDAIVSYSLEGSHVYSAVGDFTVSVCANDLADGVVKCDESIVTVTAADFVASDLVFDPAGASNNYHVLFTAANIGTESVDYKIDDGANALSVNGVMPSGEYQWSNLSVPADRTFLTAGDSTVDLRATPGSVELLEGDVVEVCIDVNDVILESNEENNCVSATFTTASETGEEVIENGGDNPDNMPIPPDLIPTEVYAWDLINTEYVSLLDIPSGASPLSYIIYIESLNQGDFEASVPNASELLFDLCSFACTDEEGLPLVTHDYTFFGLADTSVWGVDASVTDNAEEITTGLVDVTNVLSFQYCVDSANHVIEADETNNCLSFANPFFVDIPAEEETPEDACEEDDDLSFEGEETPEDACDEEEEETDDEGDGEEEEDDGLGLPDGEEAEGPSPDLYVANAVYDSASMILSYDIGNQGSVSLLAADYPDGRNRFRLNGVNLQITPWSFHSALFNAYATAGAERTRDLPLYFFVEMLSLGDGTTNELEICTDSSNLVTESDELNNCTTVSFVYEADVLPDLYASISSVDDSFVYFSLGNAGLVDVFPSQFGVTEYYLDGAVVYNDVWSTSTVAASYLASAGVLSDQFSIEGLSDGEHTFKVCVDTVNRIEAELSEANNCASTTFTIGTDGGLGDGGSDDDGAGLPGDDLDPSDEGTDGTDPTDPTDDGEDGTGGGLGDGGSDDDGAGLPGDDLDPSDEGTDGTDPTDPTDPTDDGGDLSGDGTDPSDTGTDGGSSGGSSGGVATPGSGSGSSGGSGSSSSGGVILAGSEEVILTGEEIAACGEMNFVDVSEDHEDYDAIYQLWCEGVVHGRDALHFVASDWIKRDEVAKIVARLFGYVTVAHSELPELTETSYTDVSVEEPLGYYVEVLTEEGYFEEEVAGEFRPHEDMSYGEIIDLLTAVTGGEVVLAGYESEDSVERGVFADFVLGLFE